MGVSQSKAPDAVKRDDGDGHGDGHGDGDGDGDGHGDGDGLGTDSPDHCHGQATGQRIPAVEEVFVQRIAYRCGVTEEELEKKKVAYLDHLSTDPTLSFKEFKCLYKDLSSGLTSDDFLQEYVEALFHAFDADQDSQLTFQEWQVGFYLLLLLPKGPGYSSVSTEDFLLAMEILFRLYDQDGNTVVTEKEVSRLTTLLGSPTVSCRLTGGTADISKAVGGIDLSKYAGGINLEDFLAYFRNFLEENQTKG